MDGYETRRRFLALMSGAAAAVAARSVRSDDDTKNPAAASAADTAPRSLGAPRSGYGERAPEVTSQRYFPPGATPGTGASRTPLADQLGIITPSGLHFERHHSGVPALSAQTHELLVHGLVRAPTVFSMDALRRLPAVSRIHFLECAGNSGMEHLGKPQPNVQISHGLVSGAEWTGVRLKTLLDLVGVRSSARWVIAEGLDASRHHRSIPIDKARDDVLVAYGQNGEPLRPELGYPLRLFVPGWEGNVSVKWLGRLELADQPAMSRDEAVFYTDLLPDGRARKFSYLMDAKSVIVRPSGGQRITQGWHSIEGFAWSGRGRIVRVEVSTDGGAHWRDARIDEPALPKAMTRFTSPWAWAGEPAELRSRCTDDTGYVQPERAALLAARGINAPDHYNGIKSWFVRAGGEVSHEA